MENSLGYYKEVGIIYSTSKYTEEDIMRMCFEEEINLCLKYQYPYKINMEMPDVMIILSTYDNVLEDLCSPFHGKVKA